MVRSGGNDDDNDDDDHDGGSNANSVDIRSRFSTSGRELKSIDAAHTLSVSVTLFPSESADARASATPLLLLLFFFSDLTVLSRVRVFAPTTSGNAASSCDVMSHTIHPGTHNRVVHLS